MKAVTVISVRLADYNYQKLKRVCARKGVSINSLLNLMVADYLQENGELVRTVPSGNDNDSTVGVK